MIRTTLTFPGYPGDAEQVRCQIRRVRTKVGYKEVSTMADGQQHKQRPATSRETEDVVDGELEAAAARKAEIDADVDSILDEIDDVLEENAEEFVASFVQKGGQ
jgi:ubiquitin-like protein Pup